jgi:flagellar hook protein FlgE
MSLSTALSGLLGAQAGLDVASNDLANASTTGFKSGSALFQDIYAAGSAAAPGLGTSQQATQEDFSEGGLESTGNPLDLAIQGNGFFVVSKDGQSFYTRDGAFQLSPSGQLQNASGASVLTFDTNANGVANGALGTLTVATGNQPAKATSQVGLSAALNTADPTIGTAFNPANSATYDETTSVVAYDSLGNANHVQLYFVKNPAAASAPSAPNSWSVYAQPQNANGSSIGSAKALTTLKFNSSGALQSGGSAALGVAWGNGASAANIGFNFAGTTLASQSFAVNGLSNNGYSPGQYTGVTVGDNGAVSATYSNGQTKAMGVVAVANFINDQGLIPVSGNLYTASNTSGQPVVNAPATGVSGSIASGNLEQSNVETSNQLVTLLKYQEAYQADTSVLQTDQQDTQKLLQLG